MVTISSYLLHACWAAALLQQVLVGDGHLAAGFLGAAPCDAH